MFIALVGTTFVVLPCKTQAQFYSPYIYNNNALLNRALAHQKAKATYKRKVSKKKMSNKRDVRRKTSKVSALDTDEQKIKVLSSLTRKADVV